MARTAQVYDVLIASPSDVVEERRVLTEVVEDWNSAHSHNRKITLQAVRWETDSVPASGARPQETLNRQLVKNADILIGVFWHRLGTPTGNSPSGTAEEIDEFRRAGKTVALYFKEAPIPHKHDPEQFRVLNEYRRGLEKDTLYHTFNTPDELRRIATRHLAKMVNELSQADAQVAATTTADQLRNMRLRARGLRDHRLTEIKSDASLGTGAKVVLHMVPVIAVTDPDVRLDFSSIADNLGQLTWPMMRTDLQAPRFNADGLRIESVRQRKYLQLYNSGMIESVDSELLDMDTWRKFTGQNNLPDFISMTELEDRLIAAVSTCMGLYKRSNVEPPVFTMVSLLKVKGFRMMTPALHPAFAGFSHEAIDRDDLVLREVALENFSANPSSVLKRVFDLLPSHCLSQVIGRNS